MISSILISVKNPYGSGGNSDIHVWDIVRESMAKLTLDEADEDDPLWTPDGKKILFESYRDEGRSGIYWKAVNGIGAAEELFSLADNSICPYSFLSDGSALAIVELARTATGLNGNIGLLSLNSEITREPLLQERYAESNPQISPNGKWMSYISNESGLYEV